MVSTVRALLESKRFHQNRNRRRCRCAGDYQCPQQHTLWRAGGVSNIQALVVIKQNCAAATCNFAAGVGVPMPTFVSAVAPFWPLMLQYETIAAIHRASVPSAVALRLPAPTLARAPILTLLAPLPLVSPHETEESICCRS